MYKRQLHHQKGFTLVEVAVVLVIIGVLIFGVLKGMAVLDKSKIHKIYTDLETYRSALFRFNDLYYEYPGDFSRATKALPGCNATNFCVSGNRDNIIGTANAGGVDDQTGTGDPDFETTQFWKHLEMAGMIYNVDITADPAAPRRGVTHPSSPFSGAYSVYHFNEEHWISLKKCPDDDACTVGALKAAVAQTIDMYYDRREGPADGRLFTDGGDACDFDDDSYDLTESAKCNIFYKLNLLN